MAADTTCSRCLGVVLAGSLATDRQGTIRIHKVQRIHCKPLASSTECGDDSKPLTAAAQAKFTTVASGPE